MKHYVGIDLGTTNSAICSFDGEDTRVWKSPEQNDVTPSVIYLDPRGNKYVGKRAYDAAPHDPCNAAMLFKRAMGTSTLFEFKATNAAKTPEECSAEVLRVLSGYLPEEVRTGSDSGTVITVPAAFNQMQKDATTQAASIAGIGEVALMQEPVAAVMSVMRSRPADGMFLIYDLGGGTLDVAIAESLNGRVNLLAHGGIGMCGGRDFDRALVDNIIKPWLLETFDLPNDLAANPRYTTLMRLAAWATERAKIELSSSDAAVVALSEAEARLQDESGRDVYVDVPIDRATLDRLIEPRIDESVTAARETLSSAGLGAYDIERVVFVGGPTNYKPLRDRVAFELGVPGSAEANPMTAVAEGAAVFAESIDWQSESRGRKSSTGAVSLGSEGTGVSFKYTARTPDVRAKIFAQVDGAGPMGAELQVDSLDTGWTSGRCALKHGASIEVTLPKSGVNTFKVFVFDASGSPMSLPDDRIVITRTAATISGIPASHSIAVEVLDKLGGTRTTDWLVRAGDQLPVSSRRRFKAAESLKAGSNSTLNFKLVEGESDEPADNRPIGTLKIAGTDFDSGVIASGADLVCDFEMLDSGQIVLEVSVPDIGGVFHSHRNFYSRQEGQLDFRHAAAQVAEEGQGTLERLEEIEGIVDSPKLAVAKRRLEAAASLDADQSDPEVVQEALEGVYQARRVVSELRSENLKDVRRVELDRATEFYEQFIKEHTRPSEATSYDNLIKSALRAIDRNDREFENCVSELRSRNFEVLWRQDWFVLERFRWMASSPHHFADPARFNELVSRGMQLLEADDIAALRKVVAELVVIQADIGSDADLMEIANIVKGW